MMEIQAALNKTILFITHDLNEALRIGDRVCIMKDGAVVQIGTPEEILTKPATGYVAEFVQDVDQGRVIQVIEVMTEPKPITSNIGLQQAMRDLDDRIGAFVIDSEGKPVAMLTAAAALRASVEGSSDLRAALTDEFETTSPTTTLNDVYFAAGKGRPIAVVDENGVLVGDLDPREIMEEMGRVERLIEGFEREVYL
jgi:glycine betaine/proline transport system ATP-binding protein